MDAYKFVRQILKKQNDKLLEDIANKYGLDTSEMKTKYLSPSFYGIDIKKTFHKQ